MLAKSSVLNACFVFMVVSRSHRDGRVRCNAMRMFSFFSFCNLLLPISFQYTLLNLSGTPWMPVPSLAARKLQSDALGTIFSMDRTTPSDRDGRFHFAGMATVSNPPRDFLDDAAMRAGGAFHHRRDHDFEDSRGNIAANGADPELATIGAFHALPLCWHDPKFRPLARFA